MPLKLIRTIDPALDVVTDAEQKEHSKIDLTDDDAYVALLNEACIEIVEDRLERGFVTQTWELSIDKFPRSGCPIELCRSPAIDITSIKYNDTDGVEITLAATEYTLDDKAEPPVVVEAFDKTWPETRDEINAVTVLFTVGYGTDVADTPEKFKTIIKMLFAHFYTHREPVTQAKWNNLPEHMKSLFDKYELKVFG